MANDFTGFMPEETGAEQVRVESFFKPNLQLLDKALATRQTMYNTNLDTMAKAKAKVEEVNSLEGFDRNEWFKMQEDYDKEIGNIMSLYEGDLSKANAELYGFTTKVGKDFGIHGKATAINERALGYMMNKKELDKRLAEKKITQGQYWRLQEELEKTAATGIGTDPKAYKGWRKINPIDAVDFDQFANEFLKNKEADLNASGYERSYDSGGFYIWTNKNHDVITYDSLMHELGTAYKNAAEKTNQLVDDFDYNLYKNNIKITNETYVNKYTKEANDKKTIVEQLKVTPKTREEVIKQQELLNRLQGKEDKPTGVLSKNDVIAKQLIIDKYSKLASQYEAEADRISVMNNDQLRSYYYQDYIDGEIRRLADPYAGAKSRDRVTIQRDVQKDPWIEHEIYKRNREFDRKFDNIESVVTTSEGKGMIDGKNNKTLTEAMNGLKSNKTELEKKINQLKADHQAALDSGNKALASSINNELATLNRQYQETNSKIATLNNAQFELDEKMKEAGFSGNKEIVYDYLGFFINNLPLGSFQGFSDSKQFNTKHYALIASLNEIERKTKFGTADIEEIKKKPISEINKVLYETYKGGGKYFHPRLRNATDWMSEKLYDDSYLINETQEGFNIKYLRSKIENNTNHYFKKSNSDLFLTEQTEFFSTPFDKGNVSLNRVRSSYANALANNPHGFKTYENEQADKALNGKVFYDKDNKEVRVDLSKTKPEDIGIARKSMNGIMYMQVRLRDRAGEVIYERDGTPATEWVVSNNPTAWESDVRQLALENISALTQRVANGSSNFSEDKLRLNPNAYNEYLKDENQHFLNHLGQLASVNYLSDWQRNGAHTLKKGDAIFLPDGDGQYYAIAREKSGQWAMYSAVENPSGELQINTKQGPIELPVPSLGGYMGYSGSGTTYYFNSADELAKAVQFINLYPVK